MDKLFLILSSKLFWIFGGVSTILFFIAKYIVNFGLRKIENYFDSIDKNFCKINNTLENINKFMANSDKDKEILEVKINANNELLQSQINEIKLEMKELKDRFNNQKK